jgi:hypothetical protein
LQDRLCSGKIVSEGASLASLSLEKLKFASDPLFFQVLFTLFCLPTEIPNVDFAQTGGESQKTAQKMNFNN